MFRVGRVLLLAALVGCGGGGGLGGSDASPRGDGLDVADRGTGGGDVVGHPPRPDAGADTAPDGDGLDAQADTAVADTAVAEAPDAPGADVPAAEVSDAAVGEVASIDAADAIEAPEPATVKVGFTGSVVTVASMPLGFDGTVRTKPVTGSFTYNLGYVDDTPAADRGKFERFGKMAFTMAVDGHTITGSGKGILQTENLVSSDTFRYLDGKQPLDNGVRTMKLDGVDAPTLRLSIAISDDSATMLTSDKLPAPFPAVQIKGALGITHTFAFTDDGGTLLIQLDTLVNQ